MATEARKLRVGTFAIAATLIGVATAIWLGASHWLENTSLMVTYFSESVQGLEPGAAVKYRGVPAGRVEHIDIAPDGDLIQVVMSIDTEFAESVREDETLRASLQLAGITGLRYVEIDRHSGESLQESPKLTFKPPYPYIPATPSSFKAVTDALQDIYDKVMSVDLAGISADARTTLQAADQVLRDERIPRILGNLADVSESAARVTHNVADMTARVKLEPAVKNLEEATAQAKDLFADLNRNGTGEQIRDAVGKVDDLAGSARELVFDLQVSVERLNRVMGNLEDLSTEVRQQPSRLLFAQPPPSRRPAEDKR